MWFTPEQACELAAHRAVRLRGSGREEERPQLGATGVYQLDEPLKASERLDHTGIDHAVLYLQEPGRLRAPRDEQEMRYMAPQEVIDDLFPRSVIPRVFVTDTRPEPFIGAVWLLLVDPVQTPVLGYVNHGGTLDALGMLFANKCTWAHVLAAAAVGLGEQADVLLNEAEPPALFDPELRRVG